MLCMSIHGMRMFTEPFFYRGRHDQEGEEGKEDREGSHQEGGKEDFKEKVVIVSATERLPPPGSQPGRKAKPLPKDLKCPSQPFGSAARHYKAGPLCSCIKVRFFVSASASGMICSCAKDRRRMAATLLRRGSREPSPRNADAPLIQIYFTATTRSGFVVKIKIATTSSGKRRPVIARVEKALKSDWQITAPPALLAVTNADVALSQALYQRLRIVGHWFGFIDGCDENQHQILG